MTGVREMCDVCDSTLFNHHWACARCGFVVCVDCYRSRREGRSGRTWGDSEKDRDSFSWLLCTTRQQHEVERLMLVQIIAGNALEELAEALRKETGGDAAAVAKVNGEVNGQPDKVKVKIKEEEDEKREDQKSRVNGDAPETKSVTMSEIIDKAVEESMEDKKEGKEVATDKEKSGQEVKKELKHFARKTGDSLAWRHSAALGSSFSHEDTKLLHSKVSHAWLDGGRVLQLSEGGGGEEDAAAALELFREAWLRGRPVLVQGAARNNDNKLWRPEFFASNFGDINADFVNVADGSKITNEPLRIFWDGFADESRRKRVGASGDGGDDGDGDKKQSPPKLREENGGGGGDCCEGSENKEAAAKSESEPKDEQGQSKKKDASVALKICDWPPGGDEFGEVLPDHARDLAANLPLPRYTSRRSPLNMAACLPDVFVRSDLGPRPCFVQGLGAAAADGDRCSVNLHSEVSDVVSVLLHCSSSVSGESAVALLEEALSSKLDDVTRSKIALEGRPVGCAWQVFHPMDADKIRDYLNGRSAGGKSDPDFDPIHEADQFLDREAIRVLREDHGVAPFNVVQFLGEAVVVPAGAPRQVREKLGFGVLVTYSNINLFLPTLTHRFGTLTAASPCPWTSGPPRASRTATS